MTEQEQTVRERRGGAHQCWEDVPLHRAWLRDLDLTSPEGRAEGAAPGQMSFRPRSRGFGMRGEQAGNGG